MRAGNEFEIRWSEEPEGNFCNELTEETKTRPAVGGAGRRQRWRSALVGLPGAVCPGADGRLGPDAQIARGPSISLCKMQLPGLE